jgi:hypothetical protein
LQQAFTELKPRVTIRQAGILELGVLTEASASLQELALCLREDLAI